MHIFKELKKSIFFLIFLILNISCLTSAIHAQWADFDGDGISDKTVWRKINGTFYVIPSSGVCPRGMKKHWKGCEFQWGLPGDVPVTGDYDGDGKTELAVWRPMTGNWYITIYNKPIQYGLQGDIPVPADYDGDGKTDIAVWRPKEGNWYIKDLPRPVHYGSFGHIPVPGDYNGDGKDEVAVWNPNGGYWSISTKRDHIQYGLYGDIPIQGDYNGDGKTDLAVWRPRGGNWYINMSFQPLQWGLPGDIPVAADINGDNKQDILVWRPKEGNWYLYGHSKPMQWGLHNDIPVQSTARVKAQLPPVSPRVIVSSDIGGSDPDDFQSMVHYLVYSYLFETEGLISSPPRNGRKQDIFKVVHEYIKDYRFLKPWAAYPMYNDFSSVIKQGSTYYGDSDKRRGGPGKNKNTEGSDHIVAMARKKFDPRPLWILVWGAITDVAQALYNAPDIESKIRVYSIGGWNTKLDRRSRDYIYKNHKNLWWIENHITGRGMYIGGNQNGDLGNRQFVEQHVKHHGALGDFFYKISRNIDRGAYTIKMGDTPSVLYLISPILGNVGNWDDPTSESWGGKFKKVAHDHPNYWTCIHGNMNDTQYISKWREQFLRDWQKHMDRCIK
ncbi:signal peptide protein [Candidatus Magnetomorum sp. HK-1]|nr:signal peptide protein [Candidatus Magnetomorum sp. HK-1]